MPILKGMWALLAVIVLSLFVVSMVLGITIWSAALVLALVIGAPIVGVLCAIFLPLPPMVKGIIALSVSILILVYGLRYLGVV